MNKNIIKTAITEALAERDRANDSGLGIFLALIVFVCFVYLQPVLALLVLGVPVALVLIVVYEPAVSAFFQKHKNKIVWAYLALLASPVIAIAGLFLFGIY